MLYKGSFISKLGETVETEIVTGGDRASEIVVGEGSLYFPADDPVTVESSVNDSFDHILRNSATIRLQTREFLPDIFSAGLDSRVRVWKGGRCVFSGFIEPQAYSQGYNELYDELEVSCIDALSALQYRNFGNVGTPGVIYESLKTAASNATFGQLLTAALSSVAGESPRILYDGSKRVDPDDPTGIFDRLSVAEAVFLGGDEDEVWTQESVVEEIMRYLNLHIVQEGSEFRIFSWETLMADGPIRWFPLSGEEVEEEEMPGVVEITPAVVDSDDTTISIGETYNRILLTCKTESVDTIMENPLDDDSLTSPYPSRQMYMSEYSVEAENDEDKKAWNTFLEMTTGGREDAKNVVSDKAVITEWFMQVRDNPQWTFPESAGEGDLLARYCRGGMHQESIAAHLASNPGAAIIAFGNVATRLDHKDNAPVSKVSMENWLMVSVNGNGEEDNDLARPNANDLLSNVPCAIYKGGTSGGVLSPSDDNVTNYVVLSGKIVLTPLTPVTASFGALINPNNAEFLRPDRVTFPPVADADDGLRFYTHHFWTAILPSMTPAVTTDSRYLLPFTGTGPRLFEFKYSAANDGSDRVSKVSALACMLIIGDKCVVETGSEGKPTDYRWVPYKTMAECATIDEYYAQSFTIGFNPKIGGKLIGTEFDLQNNIDFTMGIDTEGMAIPVRRADRVSGPVTFMILGPVNTMWGEITRRHRTWFRREKWYEDSVPLLSHIGSIGIKSFEITVHSDNDNGCSGDDIIYMSNTRERFINRKDDIIFRLVSALTAGECQQLGIAATVNLNTVLDTSTGTGLLSLTDMNKEEAGKPELLYVDSYYKECSTPRVVMTQKLRDTAANVSRFFRYRHPALGKEFYVQGIGRNLIEGYAEVTLKEKWL